MDGSIDALDVFTTDRSRLFGGFDLASALAAARVVEADGGKVACRIAQGRPGDPSVGACCGARWAVAADRPAAWCAAAGRVFFR